MKKTHLIQMAVTACLICFTACSGEQDLFGNSQNGNVEKITVKANNFNSVKTKTTLTIDEIKGAVFSWAANDTIGIFPSSGSQVEFPMASGAGTNSASFTGGGWALKSASTYYAYYPFNRKNYVSSGMANKIPISYTGQSQDGDNSTDNLGKYDFMAAAGTQAVNGAVAFNLNHLGALLQLKLTMPTAATFTNVTLQTTDNSFVSTGTVDLTAATPALTGTTMVNSLSLGLNNITTTAANQTITLYMMIPPVDLSAKSLTVKVTDSNGNIYSQTQSTANNYLAGFAYIIESNIAVDEVITTVTLSEAGTLAATIGSSNLSTIKKLKIIGNVNGTDIFVIRNKMPVLTYLDIEDANIVGGGNPYYNNTYLTSDNKIGDFMFRDMTNLMTIILPNSVTSTGYLSFYGCTSLKYVTLPSNLKIIGSNSFQSCTSLESIVIPNSVTTFETNSGNINPGGAFCHCNSLKNVVLSNKIEVISDATFTGCTNLENIQIPNSVTTIGNSAFYNCQNFTNINIPNSVTTISSSAFNNCINLNNINIPNSVTTLGSGAFKCCINLNNITLPSSITAISNNLFQESGLTSFSIPSTITSIGSKAFYNCSKLNSLYVNWQTPISNVGTDAFYNIYSSCTLYVPKTCFNAYFLDSNSWGYFQNIIGME